MANSPIGERQRTNFTNRPMEEKRFQSPPRQSYQKPFSYSKPSIIQKSVPVVNEQKSEGLSLSELKPKAIPIGRQEEKQYKPKTEKEPDVLNLRSALHEALNKLEDDKK